MANNTVDFTVRIKDNASESLRKIGVNAGDLKKGIGAVKAEADRINARTVNFTQFSQGIDAINASVTQLVGVFKDLTAAYQVQLVAETQLKTVMAQRMKATSEEIQSIKDLCSAQQELGIIGDEVALSGAQQMATFLNSKTSLDVLIPAMNNLLAQQKGLNATNQDAVGIGNMMGKAMQGQVDVLQRVGVTFTEAQKKVLQYGDESERAAMLAQVIRDNVGDMNAALAATDAGKQKQLDNTLGDIKETLGSMVQGSMPFITIAAQTTTALTGATRLGYSLKALVPILKLNNVATLASVACEKLQAQARMLLTSATGAATVSTGALTVATLALTAAYTMGLSLVIAGVCSLFSRLGNSAEDASESQKLLKESTDAFTDAATRVKAEIDMEVSALSLLVKSHGDEAGKVEELNRRYGEALGYHKTAAEWYDILIAKSADYCKAIGYEAQAKVIASQKAAKEMELEAIRQKKKELETSGKATRTQTAASAYTVTSGSGAKKVVHYTGYTNEYKELQRQEAALGKETQVLQTTFDTCMKKMQTGMTELKTTAAESVDATAMSYQELELAIEDTEKKLKKLAPAEAAEIARLSAYNKQLKERKGALGKMTGLGNGSGSGKGTVKADISVSPGSLEALEKKLNELKERQKKAPIEEQLTFTPDIVALEDLIAGIKERLKHASFEARYTLKPVETGGASDAPIKQTMQSSINLTQKEGGLKDLKLETPKLDLEKPLEGMDAWNAAVDLAREKNAEAIGSMGAMGGAMGSLGEVIGGQAGAWLDWAGNLLNAIAQALPQLAALSTANTTVAATGAASSVASIPVVGPIMAVAAVASVLAALTGLPKFANGGLVYGPTLGLFGEYAGASNNPEVVAPLNRLRQLIQPADSGGMSGNVRFRIDGRALTGILEREMNLTRRS